MEIGFQTKKSNQGLKDHEVHPVFDTKHLNRVEKLKL